MLPLCLTSTLRVLLKQYKSPTGPNIFKSATIDLLTDDEISGKVSTVVCRHFIFHSHKITLLLKLNNSSRKSTKGIIGKSDVYPKYGRAQGAWNPEANKATYDAYIEVSKLALDRDIQRELIIEENNSQRRLSPLWIRIILIDVLCICCLC